MSDIDEIKVKIKPLIKHYGTLAFEKAYDEAVKELEQLIATYPDADPPAH